MTDQAKDPSQEDFRDTAKKSLDANIADESASYEDAIDRATAPAGDEDEKDAAG